MRCLIDTHTCLWFLDDDSHLSNRAREIIAEIHNEVVLSIASLWEIAIKASLGKLELKQPFRDLILKRLAANEIETLPIKSAHLVTLTDLPFHHRDPFDRLMIAQAMVEDMPVLSADPEFRKYPIQVIW